MQHMFCRQQTPAGADLSSELNVKHADVVAPANSGSRKEGFEVVRQNTDQHSSSNSRTDNETVSESRRLSDGDTEVPIDKNRSLSDENARKDGRDSTGSSSEEKARSLKLTRTDLKTKCRYTEVSVVMQI